MRRLPLLDAARGAALAAMFAYHLVWDLGFLGLVAPETPHQPGFKLFGHFIAASFLLLAGAAQALAWRSADPWPRFWRRLALLTAASAAISLATFYVFPEDFVYFGILHCIALGGLFLAALMRGPVWLLLGLAAAAMLAPLAIAAPALDGPAFWWLGLGTHLHRSVDVRPFFPWFGFAVLGAALARLQVSPALPAWLAPRALVWMGRRSLAIYLLHQPVFLGLLHGAVWLAGPPPPAAQPFVAQCRASCIAAGRSDADCAAGCGCVAARLKRRALWGRAEAGRLSPEGLDRLRAAAAQCGKPR